MGGAAEDAGIFTNDVILKIENTFVNDVPELQEQIAKHQPGDLVDILIQRKGENKVYKISLRNQNGNTELINRNANL